MISHSTRPAPGGGGSQSPASSYSAPATPRQRIHGRQPIKRSHILANAGPTVALDDQAPHSRQPVGQHGAPQHLGRGRGQRSVIIGLHQQPIDAIGQQLRHAADGCADDHGAKAAASSTLRGKLSKVLVFHRTLAVCIAWRSWANGSQGR